MILLLTLCHGISHLFYFSLRLLPAAMAAKWHVSDLVQESTSMASLVSARNDCPRMAASLVKQWLLKLKGATLSATDLVPLTQHLEQLTLPEGSKQSVLEAVDELVISGGNLQSSMKLTQLPQKHDFIHNYLTQNDWNEHLAYPGVVGRSENLGCSPEKDWGEFLQRRNQEASAGNSGDDRMSAKEDATI